MYKYIAYPRSGSHFIHQVLTCYTGKHAPTRIYNPAHDRDTCKKVEGCFYVWRNPVKVIYSLFGAERCNSIQTVDFDLLTESWLDSEINRIKIHFDFYWKNAGIVVRYNDLIANNAWKEILEFFNFDYNKEKILDCSSKITVDVSIKNYPGAWMHNFMLSDEYKQGRETFEKLYTDKILNSFSEYLKNFRGSSLFARFVAAFIPTSIQIALIICSE